MNYENYRPDWNKPSIFTAQQYGTKVSVEVERSDMDLDEVMDAFQTLIIGLGYHQDAFKKWVIERAEEYVEDDEVVSEKDMGRVWTSPELEKEVKEYFTTLKQDEERFENLRHNTPKVNEEEEDEFFGKYTTDCYCGHTDKCDCGPEDGYLATEEDEDEFDDYGKRIEHPTFEWGDEPEDDEEVEPLFDGDEFELNENLKAANERYKKEVKKMNLKQKRQSKK